MNYEQYPFGNPAYKGCGDTNCVINPPSGQGTNAGCQCRATVLRAYIRDMRADTERCMAETKTHDHSVLIAALRECRTQIDNDIDDKHPADAHPRYAAINAMEKRDNPARVALKEVGEYD